MQRRSSRLANSRHRVVRFEEHGDAGGGGGARGGGASSSGAGRGAGSDSGRGASAEKCIPGRLSVGSTAVSGERFRFAVGELVAGLPCTAEVERVDAARFSGNYFSSIKLARFGVSDLLRRKTGDVLRPVREERRRQLLVSSVLSAELQMCKSFTRIAQVPPISPDVLVGRALPPGTAEDSFGNGGSSSTASSPRCLALEIGASLKEDVVLPTRWCTGDSAPDRPVTTARTVVWPRGGSLCLSAEVQRQICDVRDDGGARASLESGVVPTGGRPTHVNGCDWPDFVGSGLASVGAGSPVTVFSTGRSTQWCEVVCQVLPLRRLSPLVPGFPCNTSLEAGIGLVLPRWLSVSDSTASVDIESLAQTSQVAFWEADVVRQAMDFRGGSSTEAGVAACAERPTRPSDPSAVRDEHQRVLCSPTSMDCPVLPWPAAPDLSVFVFNCNSLPSAQATVTAALHGLGAATPATRGSWALGLSGDRSVLPWRWHWDSTCVIEAPTAWTLSQAADRVLESSIFTAAQGLPVVRALSDVRRHVDSFWRRCSSTARLCRPSATAARLERSLAKLLAILSSNRHTGPHLVDHAAALEEAICAYAVLDQPDTAIVGPIESRRPGRQKPQEVSGGFSRRDPCTPSRSVHPHEERPMTSLRAVPSSGRLGGALGESNDVQLPFEHVPLRDSSHMAPCALSLHRPTGTDAAFSDADSSTVVRAHRSGSGDPAAPMSGSGSGSGGCSAGLSGGGAAPALSELLCRKPQPPRILHNPQQLHVIQSQRDMAAQLLGRSTVVMLPPPVQSLSLVCLLAETYLRTSGSDHRCLWLSSASTAHLTSAFEFHQRALPEHHLVLLDAEPRGSSRAAAAAAQFVFASVSAARTMLTTDRSLFSFVVFDCGASAFQAKELSNVVASQPLLRLVPSTTVLLVEDAVSSLGVAVRDVDQVCAMASMAQCGATSALVRQSADHDVRGIVRASVNDYVEPSSPVSSVLRLLDEAAAGLIRPLWRRRHPILCAAGNSTRASSLLLPPAPDTAPTLRDLVADNLSGAVIEMQDEFAAAGPVQTTLVGRGSLSDFKALTTLHVLRCARDHALLYGVDTCAAFMSEAQAHYEGQVQNLRPWCQRIEEEMWDVGSGQPSVAAALRQIVALEPGGSVLIVAGSQDLASISSALPNVRRVNRVGLAEPASPRPSSSESSAEVLVADHDDLAAASDALYPRLALVLLVSTSVPVALMQFLNAAVVRCRFIRMSERAAAAAQEEQLVAVKFDAAVQRYRRVVDSSGAASAGLTSLSSFLKSPAPSVIRLPSRFCENRTPSQLAAMLASQLPPPPSNTLVVSLEVGPAFLVSFPAAVSRLTSAIVSSSLLCSRVSLTVNFPAGADMTMLAKPGGLSRPGLHRGPGSSSGGSSSSSHRMLADALIGHGRGRGGGVSSHYGRMGGGGSGAPMRKNLAAAPPKRRYAVAGTSQQDCRQMRLQVTHRE
ncbi:hypothetical protein I4F81_006381 [Pyropia yezoensis]|uniref:Uncharacterized protein n=1 Tax=Pyropia yezoensis TaxID=2788 RepID=A0ACC3C0Y2_PYRYE|nr:hypothetical protein I4F81_006381 [Neopyropia yezoensis]